MEVGTLKTPLGKTKIYWFGQGTMSILITAGIHGNEHNSVVSALRLIRLLKKMKQDLFDGRVIVIPIANPNAFKYKQRCSLIDGVDLNRVFPGDSENSATYRHAAALWGIAQTVDFIVDLHTCGYCEPYILTLHKENQKARQFVENLPIKNIVESSGLKGQLFIEALKQGIRASIIELPQDGLKISDKIVRTVSDGLLQTLINIGIIKGKTQTFEHTYFDTITRQHADNAGLFKPSTKLGKTIKKGDILGSIAGIPIKARATGYVISLLPKMFVKPGEAIAGIAKFLNKNKKQ